MNENPLMPLEDFSAFNVCGSVRLHRQTKQTTCDKTIAISSSRKGTLHSLLLHRQLQLRVLRFATESTRILCQTQTDHGGDICGRYSTKHGIQWSALTVTPLGTDKIVTLTKCHFIRR